MFLSLCFPYSEQEWFFVFFFGGGREKEHTYLLLTEAEEPLQVMISCISDLRSLKIISFCWQPVLPNAIKHTEASNCWLFAVQEGSANDKVGIQIETITLCTWSEFLPLFSCTCVLSGVLFALGTSSYSDFLFLLIFLHKGERERIPSRMYKNKRTCASVINFLQ